MGHGTSIAMWQNKPAKNGDQGLAPTEAGHITILGLLIDYQLPSFYQYIMISIYIYTCIDCFIDELDVIVWYVFCIYIQRICICIYIYGYVYVFYCLIDEFWCVCTFIYIYTVYIYILLCTETKHTIENHPYLYTIHMYILYIYYTAYVHWCFQKLEVHHVEKQFYDRPGRVTLPH